MGAAEAKPAAAMRANAEVVKRILECNVFGILFSVKVFRVW